MSSLVKVAVAVFLVALAARAALVITVLQREACTLLQYSHSADGREIKSVAKAWMGDASALVGEPFYEGLVRSRGRSSSHMIRFFPVSAGAIAVGRSLGLPLGVAATLPFMLFASLAAALMAVWSRDWRIGALFATVPPISLYETTLAGSSGWLLLSVIAGFLLVRAGRVGAAGLAFGLAVWARPEGLFACGAILLSLAAARRFRDAARLAAGAACALGAGAGLVAWRFMPLLSAIASGGGGGEPSGPAFLDFPGRALVDGLASAATPAWKLFYVPTHLAAGVVGLGLLVLRYRRAAPTADRVEVTALATWLTLQITLVLCLRGSQGFDDLPRYLALASPAAILAFVPWLPRSRWPFALACAVSFAIALIPAAKNARPECVRSEVGRPDVPASAVLPV